MSAKHGVTVVIPTYGGRSSIVETVSTLLANSPMNLEVIVVSDGDSTLPRKFLANIEDPRLRIVEKDKEGSAAARNFGIELASYTWVGFVDDDDIPRINWFSVWEKSVSSDVLAITAGVEYWRDGEKSGGKICRLDFSDGTMGASTLLAGAFWVQRSVLESVGGYDEALRAAQNQDLGLRICDWALTQDTQGKSVVVPETVIDLFVEEAISRDARYGTSRAKAAEVFLQRHAARLENDKEHHAALFRIISRQYRLSGMHGQARKFAVSAVRRQPFAAANWRSLILAYFPKLSAFKELSP